MIILDLLPKRRLRKLPSVDKPDDKCSTNQLVIQNNVVNIKTSDLGSDNNYNPGF